MNQPTFAIIAKAMSDAELTPSEMIQLLPIGRATFYNWRRGEVISDLLRYRLSVARCQMILKAVDAKRLPLDESVERTARMATIKQVLDDVKSGR